MATKTQQPPTVPHLHDDHLVPLVVVVDTDGSNNDKDDKCNHHKTGNEIEVPYGLSCSVSGEGGDQSQWFTTLNANTYTYVMVVLLWHPNSYQLELRASLLSCQTLSQLESREREK